MPQLGAKTNSVADVWVCVLVSSFTRALLLLLPSCNNVTYLMTPAENGWSNICVLVVLVFVRDGLQELQSDMWRPAEESPDVLF